MSEPGIRPYAISDREAVRSICFATGFMGEPVDWLWRDGASFADLFTRYYTDREPESLWVAERDGKVVGYLSGCVDSKQSHGASAEVIRRVVLRGGLVRPGIARFLWRSTFDILRDRGAVEEDLGDPRFPAHLHINLLPMGRGIGLGRRLMNEWLDRLRTLGVPGVHLGTFAENRNGIAFFESSGFVRQGEPIKAPGFRTRDRRRMHVQWMARSVA
ncbi:MAG TPA: GNAT family N-acetyltransferase [Candidatus Acidoferrales bacterium]|nr:GNAT family N-acetyltransferase [Candidatus Acidoferrales bacterium]